MTPENQHAITVLKESIRAAGLRNRDVERILGLSSSYLSRLFAGTIELRFEHVVHIARAVGLEPFEIIHAIHPHPKDPPSPAMERLREILRHLQPPPPPPPATWAPETRTEFEESLERALWKVLRRLTVKPAPAPPQEPVESSAEASAESPAQGAAAPVESSETPAPG